MFPIRSLLPFCISIFIIGFSFAKSVKAQKLPGWETNTEKSLINLDELKQGGPPKDGIPSIDSPEFVSARDASSWLSADEPVILVDYQGEARAYPLQILIWHEIVNDRIGGVPLLVTFCPLCYSALVFDRTADGEILEFGVSGFLRHSDLVMYDRKTETLWQQFNGRAIVGDYVGTTLKQVPSQIISFEQFRNNYPEGKILSRNTGHDRNYGQNPYVGYDNINNTPLFGAGNEDSRLRPMEKVIGVRIGKDTKAYPYALSRQKKVINDRLGDTAIVVFHLEGARSALDASDISSSRKAGSTGVFRRELEGRQLTFTYRSGKIYDEETGTQWSITGKGVRGPLADKRLEPLRFGDYFAFAWLVFWPDTEIYSPK